MALIPAALPQRPFLVDDLLRELAHETAADPLIDHGARSVGVPDMAIDAVAVAMVVVMDVIVAMVVVVVIVAIGRHMRVETTLPRS